jgi:hypothetical protein
VDSTRVGLSQLNQYPLQFVDRDLIVGAIVYADFLGVCWSEGNFAPATAVAARSDGQEVSTGFEIVPVSQNGAEGKMVPVPGHPL